MYDKLVRLYMVEIICAMGEASKKARNEGAKNQDRHMAMTKALSEVMRITKSQSKSQSKSQRIMIEAMAPVLSMAKPHLAQFD